VPENPIVTHKSNFCFFLLLSGLILLRINQKMDNLTCLKNSNIYEKKRISKTMG